LSALDPTPSPDATLEFQSLILASVRESIIAIDLRGLVTYWNEGATEIFGYTADEMLGHRLSVLYPEDDIPANARLLEEVLRGEVVAGEWRGRRKDGSLVWLDVRTSLLRAADGTPIGALGVSTDIDARKAAERDRSRLAAALEQASDAVLLLDAEGRVEYLNRRVEEMSGYGRDELQGEIPTFLVPGSTGATQMEGIARRLAAGRSWLGDVDLRRKDASRVMASATISPVTDQAGGVSGYVALVRDVTRDRQLEDRQESLARERAQITHALTDLPTASTPEPAADAICSQVLRMHEIAWADLLAFEPDGTARTVGVAVARGIAAARVRLPAERTRTLRARAAQGPWIERWAAPSTHPRWELARDLGVSAAAFAPILVGERLVGLLAVAASGRRGMSALTERLPAILDIAALAGAIVGPAIEDEARAEAQRGLLRDTIRERRFRPVFQPIVDLASRSTLGFEALTRFDDGTPPERMFEIARNAGLGLELEAATLGSALEAAVALPANRFLDINVSPELILAREPLRSLLRQRGFAVLLEVTEHVRIDDYAALRQAVTDIGPHVELAVDDAGAGFASLRHISELRPSLVKLDQWLVHDLASDPVRQGLVAGMAHFAERARVMLVAEGIETETERQALMALGVHAGQGYLFGPPAPAE
jgi:PAS domain S-box-containing protein